MSIPWWYEQAQRLVMQAAHGRVAAEDGAWIREAAADRVLAVERLDGPTVRRGRGRRGGLRSRGGGGGLSWEGRPACKGTAADRRCEEEHRGRAALNAALEMRVGSHAATVEGGRNGSLSAG